MGAIGVLALQGAFLEHVAAFAALGVPTREVRTPGELAACVALVIPGGESTAMCLIAQRTGMWEPLRAWVAAGRPTWGTCAGMVLLAERAQGGKAGGQPQLGGVDVEVHRNYFGAQLASFQAPLQLHPSIAPHFAARGGFTGVFIRAPAILHTSGADAVPLAWVRAPRQDARVPVLPSSVPTSHSSDAERVIVAVQQGPLLVTAFHPELTGDPAWHALFARQVEEATASGGGARLLGAVPATLPAAAAAAPVLPQGAAPGESLLHLTPGTSSSSSFKHAAADGASARAGPPRSTPLGRVCSDSDTGGHALSHAIARRAILHPPS